MLMLSADYRAGRRVHVNTADARSNDRRMTVENNHHMAAALYESELYIAAAVNGSQQARRNRSDAVIGVTGNAKVAPAETVDSVTVIPRLHIDPGTGIQTRRAYARRKFRR
jgi:hypothetical protein